MHDNPLCVKVEVEDTDASPSPAPPKITGSAVITKALMLDVVSLKAFLEAVAEKSAAVAAAVEESTEAAAAVTMTEMMVGGVMILGGRAREITPLSPPWTSWR
jgi:hypothetical protein